MKLTANAFTTIFYKVASHRNGVYALIDYVNFKGEGGQGRGEIQGTGLGAT